MDDSTMHVLFTVLAVCSLLYGILVAAAAVRVLHTVPVLERLSPARPVRWPRVSVIVPACNEQESIERAMRSRLAEQYPNAEYIVIDDRSTDGTGEIVDQLASDDARVVGLHVRELPGGWLGKVHAMHVGLGRATGEWILFSDADVHHEPGTLARVIAHCEEHGIDHVAVFPSIWSSTFGLDVLMNTFLRICVVASRAWSVTDPRSRASVGGGNFNLVRRAALERAGGLEPLRLEVVDDAGLGQALKWTGARQAMLNARGFVGLSFYRSVREAVRGMEKNGFAALGRFSVVRFVVVIAALALFELSGLAALAAADGSWRLIAGLGLVLTTGAQLFIGRWLGRPALPSLFAAVGAVLIIVAAVRSMVLTIWRGGIEWRGTHYSLARLRRGMHLVHA